MFSSILNPVLALIIWSLLIWILMYVRRLPAMNKAGILPQEAAHPNDPSNSLARLPSTVRAAADNFNHLHEQPTIFYALAFYHHLAAFQIGAAPQTGQVAPLIIGLAWVYVILRILHSLVQITVNLVSLRFILFSLSAITLISMTLLAII